MKFTKRLLAVMAATILSMSSIVCYGAESNYENDPRLNPQAMEDIVVDNNSVFGFSPDPDSARLGAYSDSDWSDISVVAPAVKNRFDYMNSSKQLIDLSLKLKNEGKNIEEIARTVSARRNEIRLESYENNPEGLKKCKESNFAKYGNENGPTAEFLFDKYGSWETVLEKAFDGNSGMDACLGMYDINYNLYIVSGRITGNESSPAHFTVRKNDSLSKIAKKFYGDASKWPLIYNANKDIIENPSIIHEGTVLSIVLE